MVPRPPPPPLPLPPPPPPPLPPVLPACLPAIPSKAPETSGAPRVWPNVVGGEKVARRPRAPAPAPPPPPLAPPPLPRAPQLSALLCLRPPAAPLGRPGRAVAHRWSKLGAASLLLSLSLSPGKQTPIWGIGALGDWRPHCPSSGLWKQAQELPRLRASSKGAGGKSQPGL